MTVASEGRWGSAGARALDAVAQALGLDPPQIEWAHRVRVRPMDVLLGTADDLAKLVALQAEEHARFVAAARLPLPATLLSIPAARPLARAAQDDLASPAGRLLDARSPEAVPALARRVGGQPFLLTGCPELSLLAPRSPPNTWTILFPGDLALDGFPRDEALELQERMLERALRPIAKQGLGLEIRATLGAPPISSPESLREIVPRVASALAIDPAAIRVRGHEGFGSLAATTAVLALTERDLLRALAAGAERVAYAAFAFEPDFRAPAAHGAPGRLGSAAELAAWVAEDGRPRPNEATARIAAVLGPLSTQDSAQRVAQAVLSSVSDS